MYARPLRHSGLIVAVMATLSMATITAHAEKISLATWGGDVSTTWRRHFVEPFSKETGIEAELTEVPNPESSIRSLASKAPYNVALVTYFDAIKLYKDGLIEGLDAKDIPEIANVAEKEQLKGPDGKLLGAPAYYTLFGIAYNNELVKRSEVTSWKAFADPSWKGRIAISQPIWLAAYQLSVLSYAAGGTEKNIEPGIPAFKKYVANAAVLYSSLAQLTQLLSRGEVEAAPFYFSHIWAMRHSGVKNVGFVIPDEGALKLPYLVVVPKGSNDRAAALRYLNFVASAKPQSAASDTSGYFPMNKNGQLSEAFITNLGEPLEQARKRMIELDWQEIAKTHAERTDLVEKLIAHSK
jgi:putative spermidine/putrescine transport system substrate-binding protein